MCRTICLLLCLSLTVRSQGKLRFHPNFDPRQQRASLLRLDDFSEDKDNKTSYSYLLSLGTEDKLPSIFHNISNRAHSEPADRKTLMSVSVPQYKDVIDQVEDVVTSLSEGDGFTSLTKSDNNSVHFPAPAENINLQLEPRIPPPTSSPASSSALRRSSPADIVGFSAIRASGFSRVGDSRIYFENTVTDTNYGWDSFNSIFITHYPGLYFFTFSVKADGDGDNFKVSLIKNGEEVVSVGGAVDPSLKNVGTSASNSVLLSLDKDDRVWLQLVRGGLVETVNKKTGYSSFSGYRLGCFQPSDRPSDFTSVSLEDVAQSLDQESLDNLEENNNSIDRNDNNRRPANTNRLQNDNRPSYPNRYGSNERPAYPERPNIYKDKHIYDAFNYDADSSREHLRPAHRPFHNNGPALVDKHYVSQPNSDQDDFTDFFSGDENENRNHWNRPENDRHGGRRPVDRNNYNNAERFSQDKYQQADRYSPDSSKYGDRYQNQHGHPDRYQEDRYRDRYHINTDRLNSDRFEDDDDRHDIRDDHRDDQRGDNRNDHRDDYLDTDASAAMFFKRRQAMSHNIDQDNQETSQETHLSYGK